MNASLERARVLLRQGRPDLGEPELRKALAEEPNNAVAHGLLSVTLAERGQLQEATREAEEAVHLAPDRPFSHYALANVLFDRERLVEAKAAIEEAIRLDPLDADYLALLANIFWAQGRWRQTLEVAEQGLALDAEHDACTNLRAMALVKLGRGVEAGLAFDAALARDPENAVTHASQGWALLHRGDHPTALDHFREALRIDPQLDWALEGLVEALKARSPLYGLMLRYFLWMSGLSGKVRWAIVVGGLFGIRILAGGLASIPILDLLVAPLLAAYFLFIFLSWTADPLFNLLLRLNRFGRYALTREDVVASNWVGGCLLAALVSLIALPITGNLGFLVAAILLAGLVLPVAGTFKCRPGWPRTTMAGYTAILALLALTGVTLILTTPLTHATRSSAIDLGVALVALTVLGLIVSTWLAALLSLARPRR
jgi:tetratricopeptide (TPR) repeat protein